MFEPSSSLRAEELQERLWFSARDLHWPSVKSLLEQGANPEPNLPLRNSGGKSPLAEAIDAIGWQSCPAKKLARERIVSALLAARRPEAGPPLQAVQAAAKLSDLEMLEQLWPWLPEGISTRLEKGEPLLAVLALRAGQDPDNPKRFPNAWRVLDWALGQGVPRWSPPAPEDEVETQEQSSLVKYAPARAKSALARVVSAYRFALGAKQANASALAQVIGRLLEAGARPEQEAIRSIALDNLTGLVSALDKAPEAWRRAIGQMPLSEREIARLQERWSPAQQSFWQQCRLEQAYEPAMGGPRPRL